MARMNLFELSDWVAAVVQRIEDAEGAVDVALEAEFDAATGAFDDKVADWCRVIRDYEATAAAVSAEVDRLAKKKKSAEREVERWKTALHMIYDRHGMDRAGKPGFGARIQKNSTPSTEYLGTDAATLPESFRRDIPAKCEPDTVAVVRAWRAGELPAEVAACFKIEVGRHLRLI